MRHKWNWWHCTVCIFTNDGTENLPRNLISLHLVLTQPVVMHQLYTTNVIDNTAPLIFFSSFVKLSYCTRIYKQCVAWAAFIPRCVSTKRFLHVVPVLKSSGTTEGRDRVIDERTLGLFFDEDRTMISSFHLILVHSNSFLCTNPYSQVFGCSYSTVNNIYGYKTLIQITMKFRFFF